MLFKTTFSAYEINLEQSKIRRLNGAVDPTPRQGQDGVWKEYLEVSSIKKGHPVLITWKIEDEVRRVTETSPVVEIER